MAKQKTVFSNSEIVHVWAHAGAPHGRTANRTGSGNVYTGGTSMMFEGDTIYSYGKHFAMGQRLVHPTTGEVAFLITAENSTPTTSRHVSDVRRAARGNGQLFTVPSLGGKEPFSDDEYQFNVDWYSRRYKEAWDKSQGIGKPATIKGLRLRHWRQSEDIREEANRYSQYMRNDDCIHAPLSLEALNEYLEAAGQWERERGVALAEAQEKARATKRANDEARYLERQAALAEERRLRELSLPDRIQAWRKGSTKTFRQDEIGDVALLRIKGDVVQTSQGAEFPVSHAIKAMRLLRDIVNQPADANGIIWQRNGHTIHLGHYQIDRITQAAGNASIDDLVIHAGCHRVLYSEVNRLELEIAGLADSKEGE